MSDRGSTMALEGQASRWPHLAVLAMVCVLLLAFGLRVYHIDSQSLWTDEGRSLIRASVPFSQVSAATPVEHMPTYFAISHLWLDLAGRSDFALRFTSTIASVLAIAFAYRLARDLGSSGAGLIAALLLATGSFQIWYAQEARMYTWMSATSLLSTWMLWRLLTRWSPPKGRQSGEAELVRAPFFPRCRAFWPTFTAYVLATTATIYLHHYGFVLPLTQTVFVLLWLALTRDIRGFWRWVIAGFCVVALYVPAVPRLLGMLSYSGWEQKQASVAQLPWYFLTAYTAGDSMPQPWHTWLPWFYLGLVAIGGVAWWRKNRLGAILLVCGMVVPIAAAAALALAQPQFHERYTMLVTAPLLILVGHGFSVFTLSFWQGLTGDRRRFASRDYEASRAIPAQRVIRVLLGGLAAVALAVMVCANGLALNRLYFDRNLQKADYRAAASLVQAGELPGDVIIADDSMLPDIFPHYYSGVLPVHDLTLTKYESEGRISAEMAAATYGARRVWMIEHSGGKSPITALFLSSGWLATDFDHNGLHLDLFGLPSLTGIDLPVRAAFGQNLVLKGGSLAGESPGSNPTAFRAGDIVAVSTRWQVLAGPGPLRFSLRLLDPGGAARVAADYVPQGGLAPTENWKTGTTAEDRRALLLPPDLAPGAYHLWLTLYDPLTGAAVPVEGQPGVTLASIDVLPAAKPPDPRALAIPNRIHEELGPELEVLGFGAEPAPLSVSTGGTLWVWWRARARPSQPCQVRVEVGSSDAAPIATSTVPFSLAPQVALTPGEIIRARYPLAFAPDATSGTYNIILSLVGPDGKALGPRVAAGKVAVRARPRTYRLPRVEHPLEVKLGPSIFLKGYAFERGAKGQQSKLTLYWQAAQRVTGEYKVFVHVLNGAGQIVAQGDSFPADGAAPTHGWLAGEVILDTHLLSMTPGGPYRILAGLYDPVTGQRLPALDAKGNAIQDAAILVGELTVPR